jgi:hypothetical protein
MVNVDRADVDHDAGTTARQLWNVVEPVHAIVYFAAEVHDAYRQVGLKGFWMGYFAGRSHPLGTASPELVTATFFNFHHAMVRRAIPDAWARTTPERLAAARLGSVHVALRRLLGDLADGGALHAADLAEEAARGCDVGGRPLFAAHAAQPWPTEPLLRVWHAATLLREHRGDGHVAAHLASGLTGLDAHILLASSGRVGRDDLQPNRGWSDDEWTAAEVALARRGLVEDGRLTSSGEDVRAHVERLTDRLAAGPIQRLGADRARQLVERLHPLAQRIVDGGGIPVPNAMGVPWPPA